MDFKVSVEQKLEGLRAQLKQLQDNANAIGGAIQLAETLLSEFTADANALEDRTE